MDNEKREYWLGFTVGFMCGVLVMFSTALVIGSYY